MKYIYIYGERRQLNKLFRILFVVNIPMVNMCACTNLKISLSTNQPPKPSRYSEVQVPNSQSSTCQILGRKTSTTNIAPYCFYSEQT